MWPIFKALAITAVIAIVVLFIMGVAYILIPVTIACIVIGFIYALVKHDITTTKNKAESKVSK